MAKFYLNNEGLQIARGVVYGTSHINKFGYNTSVSTTYAPITDLGTNVLPETATVVSLVSSSASDDDGGVGANEIEVQGLDANFTLQVENVTLNGTSEVTTTNTFIRVFRMRIIHAGSNDVNVGNITASIGGSNVARISAGQGQTLMAVYTVPAGKKAYLCKFQGSLSKNQEANFQIRTKVSSYHNHWNVKGLWGTFSNTITYDYPIPLEFDEKTDIEIRGKAGATSEMGALFDLILIDK